jgi:eukaryotic-like serine/threonine-protein kinase
MATTRLHLTGQPTQGSHLGGPPLAQSELRSIGGYRLLRQLGEGGMGLVYLGYQERQGIQVAIKVLSDRLVQDVSFVHRFYREARNGAWLNHPHIVRTYHVGLDQEIGKHYLVLEYIDGLSAFTLLDRHGPLPIGDAVHIALGVAWALEHAHDRRIIHRDIKPDNILLTRTGVAKLADLGLAKNLDERTHLTVTRQGFGTTPYMPYEQALNARYADARSDIYALGATLYHLVTGLVPFTGSHDVDVIEKKMRGHYPPARTVRPDLPPVLEEVLARMLARDPDDRYQTAREVSDALERTGLAVGVPGFVAEASDGENALTQASPNPSNVPTRLNLEVPANFDGAARKAGAALAREFWLLRYRTSSGRICTGRGTTNAILRRLRAGRLPRGLEARRQNHARDAFHPLAYFPEFQTSTIFAGRLHPQTRSWSGVLRLTGWARLQGVGRLVAAGTGIALAILGGMYSLVHLGLLGL